MDWWWRNWRIQEREQARKGNVTLLNDKREWYLPRIVTVRIGEMRMERGKRALANRQPGGFRWSAGVHCLPDSAQWKSRK